MQKKKSKKSRCAELDTGLTSLEVSVWSGSLEGDRWWVGLAAELLYLAGFVLRMGRMEPWQVGRGG
jgi:hypothetical protein